MNGELFKENNKLREWFLDLKESIRYLKEINESFNIEITKIRHSREECRRYVSLM